MAIHRKPVSEVDPELVKEVDRLAEMRADVLTRFNDNNDAFEKKQAAEVAAHAAEIAAIQAEMDGVDAGLWRFIKEHEDDLIKPGLKSFITGVASFQFTDFQKTKTVDVADTKAAKAIMAVARDKGVVRLIAKAVRTYAFDKKKFFAALEKMDDKLRAAFQPFLQTTITPASQTLNMKLNQSYPVFIDKTRISRKPIPIKKPADVIESTSEPES